MSNFSGLIRAGVAVLIRAAAGYRRPFAAQLFGRLMAMLLVAVPFVGHAQMTQTDEWMMRIKTAQMIGPLGDNLFGDSTNYYNGSTSFRQVDVSLPGNNSLPVEIARTLSVKTADGSEVQTHAFATWDLDVPYMSGVFSAANGWQVNTATPNNRCTGAATRPAPPVAYSGSVDFRAHEYWRGNSLHIPGSGSQTLLAANTGSAHPSNGQTTALITSQFWQVQCTATLAAGNTGFTGEGFIAISPAGVQYRFDWMVSLPFDEVARTYSGSNEVLGWLQRSEIRLYPTQVTDRFGNWVRYTWSGSRLTQIQSSDGRTITLTYNANGNISQVSANGRVWTYTYGTGASGLTRVQLPDGSAWTLNIVGLFAIPYYYPPSTPQHPLPSPPCYQPADWSYVRTSTMTMTHPSGAVGTFTFTASRHGRTSVIKRCSDLISGEDSTRLSYGAPILMDNAALADKTISGPGLTPQHWA